MSVPELQARLDEVSADIDRQKEVLRKLECSKSGLQSQINAVHDPVAKLPLEISSEIFILCLPFPPKPGGRHPPMLFLSICHAWKDIALSTPALWSTIYVGHPKFNLASLDTWLDRTSNHPLYICLPYKLTASVATAIQQHTHHLRRLEMYQDRGLVSAIGPFPFLESLMIFGITDPRSTMRETIDMLRACPALLQFTLDNVHYGDPTYDAEERLVFPHIRLLKFGKRPSASSDLLLRHITLPGLDTLYVPLRDIQIDDLLQFLQRSSPPLHTFRVGSTTGLVRWTVAEMEECLSRLPALECFELYQSRTDNAVDHFLTLIARSPNLLPNIFSVTFQLLFAPVQAWYQTLFDTLLARPKRVRTVRIIWFESGIAAPPDSEVVVQLRKLVADGMTIHVGTEKRNYI